MIQANELRLGNKFKSCFGSVQTVTSVEDNTPSDGFDCENRRLAYSHLIMCKENGNQYKPFEIEGEPLTEEWHNKFKVKINGHHSFLYELPRNNTIKLAVVFNGDYIFLRQGDKPSEYELVTLWNTDVTRRDMFVHEWQNLYFALTGEELTVK